VTNLPKLSTLEVWQRYCRSALWTLTAVETPPATEDQAAVTGYFWECKLNWTRLKRLPVISCEHFRKTRTIYFYGYIKIQIPICKMESQILALKKRRLVFQIPIGTSIADWYFKYQLVFRIHWVTIQQQQEQQSEYKSRASTTCSRLKMKFLL
jgi:hypothetical protein